MTAYYNENDPYAAEWLRNLIRAGHIALGEVDERSIEEVEPDDIRGFDQCHFFAGIGGWSYALRLAGVDDDERIWTGSCPCQSLSSAGKRQGHADRRHLWPVFFRLIVECRPATVLGEQVASDLGREWFAAVRIDLEEVGYACGAADLPSAGVGAPHIRQRLCWVADSEGQRCERRAGAGREAGNGTERRGRVEHSDGKGWLAGVRTAAALGHGSAADSAGDRLGDSDGKGLSQRELVGGVQAGARCAPLGEAAVLRGAWDDCYLGLCADGKLRPVPRLESGIFPLAHGVPPAVDGHGPVWRQGALKGAGNAINPVLTAAFIRAVLESRQEVEVDS